jgi:hypothetical protein
LDENDPSSRPAEKSRDYYELFVMISFLLIVILQVFQIIAAVFNAIKNFIISYKLNKKREKTLGENKDKDKHYTDPRLVWKPSVEY